MGLYVPQAGQCRFPHMWQIHFVALFPSRGCLMCGLKSVKVNPRDALHETCITNDRHTDLVSHVTLYSDLRHMPTQCHSTLLCYLSGPQAPPFQTISDPERARSFALRCAQCDGRGGPRVFISIFKPYSGADALRLLLEEIGSPPLRSPCSCGQRHVTRKVRNGKFTSLNYAASYLRRWF